MPEITVGTPVRLAVPAGSPDEIVSYLNGLEGTVEDLHPDNRYTVKQNGTARRVYAVQAESLIILEK